MVFIFCNTVFKIRSWALWMVWYVGTQPVIPLGAWKRPIATQHPMPSSWRRGTPWLCSGPTTHTHGLASSSWTSSTLQVTGTKTHSPFIVLSVPSLKMSTLHRLRMQPFLCMEYRRHNTLCLWHFLTLQTLAIVGIPMHPKWSCCVKYLVCHAECLYSLRRQWCARPLHGISVCIVVLCKGRWSILVADGPLQNSTYRYNDHDMISTLSSLAGSPGCMRVMAATSTRWSCGTCCPRRGPVRSTHIYTPWYLATVIQAASASGEGKPKTIRGRGGGTQGGNLLQKLGLVHTLTILWKSSLALDWL